MKKFYIALGGFAVFVLVSCGNKQNSETNGIVNDSAQTVEMESPVAGPTDFYLTSDSIGPIVLGERISNIPAAVPNLYDMMITTETPDAMAYTFLLANDPQFTIYDFMEGKVDVIALEGNARGVNTPKGELRVGDEFLKVFELPGVTSEWQAFDDDGLWYWKWNGLYFGVDETNISEKIGNALVSGRHAPRASDFTSDVKIGYIATGLPF